MTPRENYERRKADQHARASEARARVGWWRNFDPINALLTLATGALAIIAWFQWETLEKTDATFKAQERPWISVDVTGAANSFPVGDEGGAFAVDFGLKNFGKSPALNVSIDGAMLMMQSNLRASERQNAICDSLKTRPTDGAFRGEAIFPGEGKSRRLSFSVQPNQVSTGVQRLGVFPTFQPILVGCVRYVYFNDKSQHDTGFILAVQSAETGLLQSGLGDIRKEQIRFLNDGPGRLN